MRCPHCHAEDQHGRFCAKCGQPLYAATEGSADQTSQESEAFQPDPPIVTAGPDAAPAKADESPTEQNPDPQTDAADAADSAQQKPEEEAPSASEAGAAQKADAPATDPAAADADSPQDEENDLSTASGESTADETALAATSAQAGKPLSSHRKALAAAGLVCGLALALWGGYTLFHHYFGDDASSQQTTIADAPIVAPSGELAADTVVGHWQHYTDGSVIEKIGTDTYRWTIGDTAYEMKFKDGAYTVKDDDGNTYTFNFSGPNRLVLTQSVDPDGGIVKDPVFENGFYCGRVGQDGSLSQNLSVNTDAFDILGRTYGELAGIYGPGALTVIGDDQYIVFRGSGGNFAVQFSGETVPLKQETKQGYSIVKLSSSSSTASSSSSSNSSNSSNNSADSDSDSESTTNGGISNGDGTKTDNSDDQAEEQKDYTLEIPDMPTFPSYSAVATGTIWMDLGFLVNNCPETMTVDDLSAILGISLEVGQAPASASGYTFFGMDEGYFAGTISSNNHTFNVTGYGKSNLTRGKTQVFIQMVN